MTQVEFHVAPPQGRRAHDSYVCELIERAWRAGRAVHVHCADAAAVSALDDLLWTFRDVSFVPHAVAGAEGASLVRVQLGAGSGAPAITEVLVNLDHEVPAFFSQFEQVIETSGADEESRRHARLRYRFYKDRGYPIANRDD